MVCDDDVAIVGTANLDNRSFRLNFEVAAVIYDRGVAAQLADAFERDLGDQRPRSRPPTSRSNRRPGSSAKRPPACCHRCCDGRRPPGYALAVFR